mgnify:CR=1 FL=1
METYTPTKCALPECAHPFRNCAFCELNVSTFGWPRSILSNPHGYYQVARGLEPFKSYSKPLNK